MWKMLKLFFKVNFITGELTPSEKWDLIYKMLFPKVFVQLN